MSPAEFQRLIEREDERLELKTGAGRRPLQESFVALTNTRGGAILIGVSDDRRILGRRRDQGLDDDVHMAAQDARSVGRYEIRDVAVGDQNVVAVVVEPRTDEVAQTSDGRVLVRRGGHKQALFGRELLALLTSRSLVRYESTDSGVDALAVDQRLVQQVSAAFSWPMDDALHDRWRERGLLHESGNLTIAGALVLTDPGESLDAAKFNVDLRVYEEERSTSYVFRKTFTGAIQGQVEAATNAILERIGTEMVVTGPRRHDVPRLPRRVVREAVANAVAHRSYEIDATPVVVEVRPTAVTIISPGRLPEPVTVATLRQAQAPRNHSAIAVLRRFGLAEDSGQGIDVIQDAMRLDMLSEPIFLEEAESFTVELSLRGLVSVTERAWLLEHERAGRLESRERSLLVTLFRDGRLTNASAREALGVDSTDARSRLHRLRDAGLLHQHGQRGRAYYTLGSLGPERSDQEVVLEAAKSGALTNQRVRTLTGMDRASARDLLRRLRDEGRIIQQGQRRATVYVLPAIERRH